MEKTMAPHSSALAWKIPWTKEPGRLQSMGSLGVGHDWATSLSLSCIGEGNGNPLQCSRLENPRDGGAWWAAVYGVAQSRTWLKRLSSSSSSRHITWGFHLALVVKNPPANAETEETRVWSLGWKDPLEEAMATNSSTLASRIPWTEESGGLQSMRSQRVRYDWSKWLSTAQQHTTYFHFAELLPLLFFTPECLLLENLATLSYEGWRKVMTTKYGIWNCRCLLLQREFLWTWLLGCRVQKAEELMILLILKETLLPSMVMASIWLWYFKTSS